MTQSIHTQLLKVMATLFMASPALALSAGAIYYGDQPMYGTKMTVKSDQEGKHRITGSLKDLTQTVLGGEDEESQLACYTGKAQDICRLLEVGALELNEKGQLKRPKAYSVKKCLQNRYGNIIFVVQNEDYGFISYGINGIPQCSDVGFQPGH